MYAGTVLREEMRLKEKTESLSEGPWVLQQPTSRSELALPKIRTAQQRRRGCEAEVTSDKPERQCTAQLHLGASYLTVKGSRMLVSTVVVCVSLGGIVRCTVIVKLHRQ